MLQSDSPRNRRLGIALVSLTTLCFAALDANAKWLVGQLPVFEVVWLRFLTHALLTSVLLAPTYGMAMFRVRRPGLQVLRALMLASMTALNFWALQYLQLDVTGAIQFSVPILIALLSAKLLGEKLDARRWLAIVAGFCGVLLIVRPGTQGFHPAIILSLLNALLYASFNLLTRRLAAIESPAATQLMSAIGASAVLAPLAWVQWQTPQSWQLWALILFSGLCGGMGHFLLALAHRYASAAVLGPFIYQQIIYMTLLGWLVFDHVPDPAVVAGAVVVVASGLYLLYRELRRPQPGR